MGIPVADFNAMMARRSQPPRPDKPAPDDAPRLEVELQKGIADECARRGFVAFHGSMAHKTKRTVGEFDFVILLPGGVTLLVEAKTATGRESKAQAVIRGRALMLGHRAHLVRSLSEFHAALNAALRPGEQGTNSHKP